MQVLADLARIDYSVASSAIDWTGFEAAVDSLIELDVASLTGRPKHGGATSAVLEGALLDVICRTWKRTFADAFEWAGLRFHPISTSAAIDVSTVLDLSRNQEGFVTAMESDQLEALRFLKIKAFRDPWRTLQTITRLAQVIPGNARLVVDVNGMWSEGEVLDVAPLLADAGVAWIEEPTEPRQWPVLRRIREQAGIGIMLDESFTSASDIYQATDQGAASHVNIRVSKCGGPLSAMRMAAIARAHGLRYQVGVHVGEVGPLWAAGRHVASALGDAETVEAGRQDEWFPMVLTEPRFTVDRQLHKVPQLYGPGCGVVPTAELLSHFAPEVRWHRKENK
ncbi:enolase C-terminal domain-like protein [Streptomyces sp. NPDC001155]